MNLTQITEEISLGEGLNRKYTSPAPAQFIVYKDRVNFHGKYLEPALTLGLIKMTIPDKPRSSKQKYRITEKGKTTREFN